MLAEYKETLKTLETDIVAPLESANRIIYNLYDFSLQLHSVRKNLFDKDIDIVSPVSPKYQYPYINGYIHGLDPVDGKGKIRRVYNTASQLARQTRQKWVNQFYRKKM